MSVGGPKIPQNQQNIGHNDPVQQPGQNTGKVKTKKSLRKQIGHQLAKLLPNKAKNSASSLESGFGDGDNLSVHLPIAMPPFVQITVMMVMTRSNSIVQDLSTITITIKPLTRSKKMHPSPSKDEDQYALVDDLNLGDAPDSPEVNEESRETLDTK